MTGRKRKMVDREPNGRAQRTGPDRGTPELQTQRKWLAQGGDETKTAYPLGVMLLNGVIGEAEHQAGCRFAWLHFVIFGRKSMIARAWDMASGGSGLAEIVDGDYAEWLEARESELKRAEAALPSDDHKAILMSVAVHEKMPNWLLPRRREALDYQRCQHTLEALDALAQGLGSTQKSLDRVVPRG